MGYEGRPQPGGRQQNGYVLMLTWVPVHDQRGSTALTFAQKAVREGHRSEALARLLAVDGIDNATYCMGRAVDVHDMCTSL